MAGKLIKDNDPSWFLCLWCGAKVNEDSAFQNDFCGSKCADAYYADELEADEDDDFDDDLDDDDFDDDLDDDNDLWDEDDD